jgi:hypothetical protein
VAIDGLTRVVQRLHSIRGVNVTMIPSNGTALPNNTVCGPPGANITTRIIFTQELGDIPALIVVASALGVRCCCCCCCLRPMWLLWTSSLTVRGIAVVQGSSGPIIQSDGVGGTIRGTTENDICSNRGICDEVTGECRCFLQWGSSNAANYFGSRGDCGHVEPYIPPAMALEDKYALELRELERRAVARAESTATRRAFEFVERGRRRRGVSQDHEWTDNGFSKFHWAEGQVS